MSELDIVIAQVASEHPHKVEQIIERPSQVGWFVGQVMLKGTFGTYEYVERRVKRALGILREPA